MRGFLSKEPFRPGDVVVMADNHPVSSVADFEAAVAGVKTSGRPSVLLLIERDGRNNVAVVPLEKK